MSAIGIDTGLDLAAVWFRQGRIGAVPPLVLRAEVSSGLSFSALVAQTREAALFAFAQNQFDLIPSEFNLVPIGALGSLVDVNDETIAVALAAGVAGMLALETRASAGVGVAISVTTIPAAAYLGVAAGLAQFSTASGALGVLGANVLMMVVGVVATLAFQSARMRRAFARG